MNDAYEMGDYARDEWSERKKKHEFEMNKLINEIYELKKQEKSKQDMTNDERLSKFAMF